MILTDYFLKRELRKLISKSSRRPHQYRSMNDIKNVLFVCNSEDWEIGRTCIDRLKTIHKTVNTAIYSPTIKDVPTWYSNYLLLRGDKDVNLWGFPDKSLQQQFNSLSADIIMDFTGEKSMAMYYLILQHPSLFKVGCKQSENSAYDLSIVPSEGKDDLQYIFEQLFNYLQTISSK